MIGNYVRVHSLRNWSFCAATKKNLSEQSSHPFIQYLLRHNTLQQGGYCSYGLARKSTFIKHGRNHRLNKYRQCQVAEHIIVTCSHDGNWHTMLVTETFKGKRGLNAVLILKFTEQQKAYLYKHTHSSENNKKV